MKQSSGNIQLVQKMNRLRVLNYVRNHPNTSRPLIVQATGLSAGTITNITSYLIDNGLLKEKGFEKIDRVGRKSALLQFCSDSYGIICIILNKNNVSIFYTTLGGKPLDHINTHTENYSQDQIIKTTIDNVADITNKYGTDNILGISVIISGMVLDDNKFVLSTNLKWAKFDLKPILEEKTGLPTFFDNTSKLKACWFFNNNKDLTGDNILYLDLDGGIGACHHFNGEIDRAFLGEIGHTTIEPNGEQCECGNHGCLEAMCSVQRIKQLYKEYSGNDATLSYINSKFEENEPNAVKAINECAKYLGIGVANLINLFRATDIVFDMGDFVDAHSVTDCAKYELKRRCLPALTDNLTFHEIITNEENIIEGAAFNFCDRLFDVSFEGSEKIFS